MEITNCLKKNIRIKSAIFLVAVFSALGTKSVFATSYDFYVDADYDGEEEGSQDKPFNTISEAMEKANGGGKIYIKNGQYNEQLNLGQSVKLYGQSASGVVIKKGITMTDRSLIKDLTINGGSNAINVATEADVEIENCRIKNFSKIGINALPGGGKVKVENSSIYNGGTKGIYIQSGREIEIEGCRIYDNNEEGIDIRDKIEGIISDNEIYGNGESGVELIVGGSEIDIKNNKIQKNGASGIVIQFYTESSNKGEIEIEKNTLSWNRKYGLDCSHPSGGNPSSNYWDSSVEMEKNVINKNGIRAINPYCGIIQAVNKEEEKSNVKVELTQEEKKATEVDEVDETSTKTAQELETEAQKAEEEKLREQQQQVEESDNIILELSNIENKDALLIEQINKRKKFVAFFIGYDSKKLNLIKQNIIQIEENIKRLNEFLLQTDNDELKKTLDESVDQFSEISRKETLFLAEKEKIFSLRKIWDSLVWVYENEF